MNNLQDLLKSNFNKNQLLHTIKKKGYFLIENAFDESFCNEAINFIDNYKSEKDTLLRFSGTELRIWHSEQKNDDLYQFSIDCDKFLSSVLNKPMKTKTLLALRSGPLLPNDEDSRKGRWHLDSFTNQIKIFLFLSDVCENSGPFEFIPGTHKKIFKWRHFFNCFGLLNFINKKRKYRSLDDTWIEKLESSGKKVKPILCKAGTIMVVDTTAIHRPAPCISKERYALTVYYP